MESYGPCAVLSRVSTFIRASCCRHSPAGGAGRVSAGVPAMPALKLILTMLAGGPHLGRVRQLLAGRPGGHPRVPPRAQRPAPARTRPPPRDRTDHKLRGPWTRRRWRPQGMAGRRRPCWRTRTRRSGSLSRCRVRPPAHHARGARFWKTSRQRCKLQAGNKLSSIRTGVRVAEGAGLENRYTLTGIVGSNPTLSAIPQSSSFDGGRESPIRAVAPAPPREVCSRFPVQ